MFFVPKEAVPSAAILFLKVPSPVLPRSDISISLMRSCTARMLVSCPMFHSMALRFISTEGVVLFVYTSL